jgi:hypothetical protein
MNYNEIVAEQLTASLKDLRTGLDQLREGIRQLAANVPDLPDLDELASRIGEAIPEPAPPPPPPPEAPAPPPQIVPSLNNGLLYHLAAIEHSNTQGAILKQLIDGLAEFASRGILFIVKEGSSQAWNGFGFHEATLRTWKADVNQDPLLRAMVTSRSRMLLDNAMPGFIPAGGSTRRSMISPLLLKGKVAAFVYADSGENGKLDHYSVDILLRTASLIIDILPLYAKREPLAATLENQDIILPGALPPAPKPEEPPLFEDTGTLSSQAELEAGQASETMMGEIPSPEPEPEPEPEKEPESATESATAPGVMEIAPPPVEDEVEVEEIQAEEAEAVEVAEEEITAIEAPPPPPPPAEPAEEPIPPEDEKLHKDAARFAKLLVQEIALYHPKEVEAGKRGRNLYLLLREDIDKSKDAWEGRFSKPSVRSRDYFRKALVKFLADGDESLLGM